MISSLSCSQYAWLHDICSQAQTLVDKINTRYHFDGNIKVKKSELQCYSTEANKKRMLVGTGANQKAIMPWRNCCSLSETADEEAPSPPIPVLYYWESWDLKNLFAPKNPKWRLKLPAPKRRFALLWMLSRRLGWAYWKNCHWRECARTWLKTLITIMIAKLESGIPEHEQYDEHNLLMWSVKKLI